MKFTHIVWDFNGTLLDDLEVCITCANRLLERRGLKRLASVEAYHAVFGFPVIDYYRRMGFDFEKESYDDLAIEWVREYLSEVPKAGLCEGVSEMLELIREMGISQNVISATEVGMLKGQIEGLGITGYFDEILGLDNIKALSKTDLAASWAERVKPERLLFIGDTEHDADAAAAAGGECLLIASGHQSRAKLEKTGIKVISSASELKEILI